MARIVEQAVASKPDGLIVTIADFDVLSGPINKAVKKGVPVITINSGTLLRRNATALCRPGPLDGKDCTAAISVVQSHQPRL
jgi:simple sugar transport system substrate-binding protein